MLFIGLLIGIVVVVLLEFGYARVLLYDTESSSTVEYLDCIYHTEDSIVKYCLRPGETLSLNRAGIRCINGGQKLFFFTLTEQNISPTTVLQWSSSIERADDYASVFYNAQNNNITNTDDFLCNCTEPGTFGKYCEYFLLGASESFDDAIVAQFAQKEADPWGAQEHGDILCYTTLLCYSGLLCLDWRNICDGEQQCLDGVDEENCDKLEFNECEDNEYRCVNGMCIAEEYWLDGK
jgi:hypothetical protein